ncbi:hypothetical protein [Neobacillus bataviensis]|uniref:hypothetical protein n=1 Tax=Neobacillus bataviensis TaxID=220685 RepID=UPI001CBB60AE|nr:hypothetical protein [Neobacillus bataviensis]
MSAFVPKLWPEEDVPAYAKECKDCGLYQHGTRMVWGEGNPKAPIMILLDNPGAREDCEGTRLFAEQGKPYSRQQMRLV